MIDNPVFLKELRTKFRWRVSGRLKIAAAVLVAGTLLYVYGQAFTLMFIEQRFMYRQDWWNLGVAVHAVLIWLLCPALTANAITQEREQQTWEMLIFTRLRPGEILWGKLLSRLLPIAVGMLALFPYMAACVVVGAVDLEQFALAYGLFGLWSAFLVTSSLFMSWSFRQTATALGMSFLVVFVCVVGTGLIDSAISAFTHHYNGPALWLNPGYVLVVTMDRSHAGLVAQNELFPAAFIHFTMYAAITVVLFLIMRARFKAARR